MTGKRILSGIQPTGQLHIGNYIGAIKQWLEFQDMPDTENLFCIVDLHALTTVNNDFNPQDLRDAVLTTAAAYLAAGIDPAQSCVFRQSDVPEHSELQWLLSCLTPMSWLKRMTQYKSKEKKDQDKNMLGLFSYPVLMAADILLYRTTHVPVGEDQKQHIELARDIAESVNSRFDSAIFTLPEPYIKGVAPRVMSLRDGNNKMSKSDVSDNSRINLTDDDDTIRRKIAKAKTDTIEGIFADDARPEINNLLRIFSAVSGDTPSVIEEHYRTSGASAFKTALADALIADIAPVRTRMAQLLDSDKAFLISTLDAGAEKARAQAAPMLATVKHALGLA